MKTVIKDVIHVLQMIMDTTVKKQGNSNVIILPSHLGFKPKDKIKVMILSDKTAKVKDLAGIFKRQLRHIDTDKVLKEVKKELWGE